MAQNLETGLIINKLTGDTVGLNVQNSDALINNVTVGKGNLVGFGNTVVGQSAMTGKTYFQYSTAIGYRALKDNQSSNNTAIGTNSLSKNTTGNDNIAIGAESLSNNTTSSNNIAIGGTTLLNLSNGGVNICIGNSVFANLTAGTKNTVISNDIYGIIETHRNTIIGTDSLASLRYGGDNTTLGNSTLINATASTQNTSVGYYSQAANIDGNYNTSLGALSLEYNKKGSYNTSVGYGSGPTASYSTLTNTTCVGANSTVTKDNSVILGSPSDTNIMVGIGTSAPDDSAKLQVDSTTKGFLPPRMSAVQAEAITSPAEGLMVYITGGAGSVITSKGWWGTTGTTSSDWVKIGP
jgi:hypothetical protein